MRLSVGSWKSTARSGWIRYDFAGSQKRKLGRRVTGVGAERGGSGWRRVRGDKGAASRTISTAHCPMPVAHNGDPVQLGSLPSGQDEPLRVPHTARSVLELVDKSPRVNPDSRRNRCLSCCKRVRGRVPEFYRTAGTCFDEATVRNEASRRLGTENKWKDRSRRVRAPLGADLSGRLHRRVVTKCSRDPPSSTRTRRLRNSFFLPRPSPNSTPESANDGRE